jgi:hypothetical protein
MFSTALHEHNKEQTKSKWVMGNLNVGHFESGSAFGASLLWFWKPHLKYTPVLWHVHLNVDPAFGFAKTVPAVHI